MNMEHRKNPGVDMSITFVYFKNLAKAMAFYEEVLGFTLVIDQGFCKIYQASSNGMVGLVDEVRGFHKANDIKPIILCYRVPDVDEWYAFIKEKGVEIYRDIKTSQEEKIRAFLFHDPEGHVIEIQSGIE
jgi:predicted enzyme related to lactoylglutathione lyase